MQKAKVKKQNKGFTLIEIMTAVSIFLLVMTVSMGAIIGVFDADRKSQALRSVMTNLNFSVEAMSRELRFGTEYHCGAGGVLTTPQNCPSGADFIAFRSNEGKFIAYRKNGTAIEKWIEERSAYVPVTSSEIQVESLSFYVLGADLANTLQPRVLIKIQGLAGRGEEARTQFTLQSLVSQRKLDI